LIAIFSVWARSASAGVTGAAGAAGSPGATGAGHAASNITTTARMENRLILYLLDIVYHSP
jgi:hypothetical protein